MWPFSRSKRSEEAGAQAPAPSSRAAASAGPARPSPGEWALAGSIQRALAPTPLTIAPDAFADDLVTHRPATVVGEMSHEVSADAPSGLVTGLASVSRAEPPAGPPAAPDLPLAGGSAPSAGGKLNVSRRIDYGVQRSPAAIASPAPAAPAPAAPAALPSRALPTAPPVPAGRVSEALAPEPVLTLPAIATTAREPAEADTGGEPAPELPAEAVQRAPLVGEAPEVAPAPVDGPLLDGDEDVPDAPLPLAGGAAPVGPEPQRRLGLGAPLPASPAPVQRASEGSRPASPPSAPTAAPATSGRALGLGAPVDERSVAPLLGGPAAAPVVDDGPEAGPSTDDPVDAVDDPPLPVAVQRAPKKPDTAREDDAPAAAAAAPHAEPATTLPPPAETAPLIGSPEAPPIAEPAHAPSNPEPTAGGSPAPDAGGDAKAPEGDLPLKVQRKAEGGSSVSPSPSASSSVRATPAPVTPPAGPSPDVSAAPPATPVPDARASAPLLGEVAAPSRFEGPTASPGEGEPHDPLDLPLNAQRAADGLGPAPAEVPTLAQRAPLVADDPATTPGTTPAGPGAVEASAAPADGASAPGAVLDLASRVPASPMSAPVATVQRAPLGSDGPVSLQTLRSHPASPASSSLLGGRAAPTLASVQRAPVAPRTEPAPNAVVQRVEAATGSSLGGVTVNRGGEVSRAASAMQAKAYTTGGEVHLPDHHGSTSEGSGESLLAHELTHVAQQRELGGALPSEDSPLGQELELQAQHVERSVAEGSPLPLATPGMAVQRTAGGDSSLPLQRAASSPSTAAAVAPTTSTSSPAMVNPGSFALDSGLAVPGPDGSVVFQAAMDAGVYDSVANGHAPTVQRAPDEAPTATPVQRREIRAASGDDAPARAGNAAGDQEKLINAVLTRIRRELSVDRERAGRWLDR